jgi:uncharacterized protein (UPF0276 family)
MLPHGDLSHLKVDTHGEEMFEGDWMILGYVSQHVGGGAGCSEQEYP